MVRRGAATRALLASSAFLLFVLAGCGVLPGRHGDPAAKGMTPGRALALAEPDAIRAVKAADIKGQFTEIPGGDDECGGSSLSDNQNASKVIDSVAVRAGGDIPDPRTPRHLLDETVTRLEHRGWRTTSGYEKASGKDGVSRTLTKPKVPVQASVSAWHFTLTSGKVVPTLTIELDTACLPNPGRKG
jgi:hypothetical protein